MEWIFFGLIMIYGLINMLRDKKTTIIKDEDDTVDWRNHPGEW